MKNEVKTKNIKFCAYLRLEGINPIEVKKLERGKAEYVYSMEQKEFELHQINFNQSKFLDYANNLDAIKDLAY
jgi:hypothetical protein